MTHGGICILHNYFVIERGMFKRQILPLVIHSCYDYKLYNGIRKKKRKKIFYLLNYNFVHQLHFLIDTIHDHSLAVLTLLVIKVIDRCNILNIKMS